MSGDLHTHTNLSDGSSDIELLPRLAARAGMKFLAISDHDTALSARYARENPLCEGVALIPAVELTAFDTKRDRLVHLLCYCYEETPELNAFFDLMARRRNEVGKQSMDVLERMYPQFKRAEAQAFAARSGVVYRTHLIRLLYEYGYTDGVYKELYQELFGKGGKALHAPAYEPLKKVLALIRGANGVAILAHPSVYNSMDLARELAQQGAIDGVEIEHPRNKEEDKTELRSLAKRHDLIETGGTDFHGMHMSKPVPLGAMSTSDEQICRILALAETRRGKERNSR